MPWRHTLLPLIAAQSAFAAWTIDIGNVERSSSMIASNVGVMRCVQSIAWEVRSAETGWEWVQTNATVTESYLSQIGFATNSTFAQYGSTGVFTVARGLTERGTGTNVCIPGVEHIALTGRDIFWWEVYLACVERETALFGTNTAELSDFRFPKFGARFYRDEYRNLHNAKNWIRTYGILSPSWAVDAYAHFCSTNVDPDGTWRYQPWTESNLLADCSLPTNYFDATPVSGLDGSRADPRVMTTTWHIVTSSTNSVTNITTDACGNEVQLVGTNGQLLTLSCTNEWIAEGYTSADYGWAGITSLLSRLTRIQRRESWGGTIESLLVSYVDATNGDWRSPPSTWEHSVLSSAFAPAIGASFWTSRRTFSTTSPGGSSYSAVSEGHGSVSMFYPTVTVSRIGAACLTTLYTRNGASVTGDYTMSETYSTYDGCDVGEETNSFDVIYVDGDPLTPDADGWKTFWAGVVSGTTNASNTDFDQTWQDYSDDAFLPLVTGVDYSTTASCGSQSYTVTYQYKHNLYVRDSALYDLFAIDDYSVEGGFQYR